MSTQVQQFRVHGWHPSRYTVYTTVSNRELSRNFYFLQTQVDVAILHAARNACTPYSALSVIQYRNIHSYGNTLVWEAIDSNSHNTDTDEVVFCMPSDQTEDDQSKTTEHLHQLPTEMLACRGDSGRAV